MGFFRLRRAAGSEMLGSATRAEADSHPDEKRSVSALGELRVEGTVTRMRARPAMGLPTLAVSVTDEQGSVVALWSGRRSLGGISLGRRVEVRGVPVLEFGELHLWNPVYRLLPPDHGRAEN